MSVITVIGSGMMGSALSFPARDNGHEVRLVGTMLDRDIIDEVRATGFHPTLKRTLSDGVRAFQLEALDEALDGVDVVIGGVSSFGVDWFASQIVPRLPKGVPVLSVTKGMANAKPGELTTFPDQLKAAAPDIDFCAVGGPCTSYELADREQTTVCFCGDDLALLGRLRDLLGSDYYHVSMSTDMAGVELAVALKNAYALAVTLAVGMAEKVGAAPQYNTQAALFGQGVLEMRALLTLFGGDDENIIWGAGDLYVTVFGGRTRLLGSLLGRGMTFTEAIGELAGVTLESVVITSRVARAVRERVELGTAKADQFPLLFHIDDMINNDARVEVPWRQFERVSLR